MSEVRDNLLYTEDHEWVLIEGNVATIGLTDFAQTELGDLVYVDFECVEGQEFDLHDAVCTVEAVKTVSDVFAPIDGECIEINYELEENPELVNEGPYNAWLFKMSINEETRTDHLLTPEQYKEFI